MDSIRGSTQLVAGPPMLLPGMQDKLRSKGKGKDKGKDN